MCLVAAVLSSSATSPVAVAGLMSCTSLVSTSTESSGQAGTEAGTERIALLQELKQQIRRLETRLGVGGHNSSDTEPSQGRAKPPAQSPVAGPLWPRGRGASVCQAGAKHLPAPGAQHTAG